MKKTYLPEPDFDDLAPFDVQDVANQVFTFAGLDDDQRALAIKALERKTFADGEPLANPDDLEAPGYFFVIQAGRAEAEPVDVPEEEMTDEDVFELGPLDFYGETSLVSGSLPEHFVTATAAMVIWGINKDLCSRIAADEVAFGEEPVEIDHAALERAAREQAEEDESEQRVMAEFSALRERQEENRAAQCMQNSFRGFQHRKKVTNKMESIQESMKATKIQVCSNVCSPV